MIHPKLLVYSDDRIIDYTIDWQYINHGIIKNISQLNKGINASSSTAEVTLSHDSPYTLPILECERDLHAVLAEYEDPSNPIVHFTGYVSHDFTWTVDSHGTQAVKITLEDVGTRLLSKPYTNSFSELISGTVSYCISAICSRAGITAGSSILNIPTVVSTVAKEGETCQELLNSLCKETGYAYYFNNAGQLEIKALSTDNLSGVTTVDDSDLYDTIKLNKQARQYRGSMISFNELETRSNTLVYRDITNQSSSHKDCWIELRANDYYPDGTDANHGTFIDAVDLQEGKEVYAISNLNPEIVWTRGSGTSSITLHGVQALEVAVKCTSTGSFNKAVVSKLQAKADLTYVSATTKVIGETEIGSKDYYEYDCRWLHTQTPAQTFANFVAQYYLYCSREFTFKSKAKFQLGQIIKLHENLYSGLETYLIISTIKETDSTQVITYTANSISAFNYSKQTTTTSTSAPPSTVYVEIPDAENITTEITANPDIFYSDQRDSSSGQVDLKFYYNASTTTPDTVVWDVRDSSNNPISLSWDNNLHSEAHFDLAKKTTATYIIAKAYVTGLQNVTTQEKRINIIDNTVWNKNWGTITTLPSNDQVLNGDYFLAGQGLSGYTFGVPYVRVSGSWTQLTGNSVDNVQRLLNTLGSALNSDLTVPATSALYAWFGTLIAQDAVITNLFSKNITLLDPGLIKSSNYVQQRTEVTCVDDPSGVQGYSNYRFEESTFINHTSGYGTYTFECTQGSRYSGTWKLTKGSTVIDSGMDNEDMEYYGVYITFDGEGQVAHTGDTIVVTYGEQIIEGQGFYLGSNGFFDCNNASANNLTITGDSLFTGRFNTGVLNTVANAASATPYSASAGWDQTKIICEAMQAAGLPMASNWYSYNNPIRADIDGVTSDIYYINYYINPGSTYQIHFWKQDLAEIDINDVPGITVGRTGVNKVRYLSSHPGSTPSGSWIVGGLTLNVWSGGNLLEVNIPDKDYASGNPSNTLFKGALTTVNNVQCYPVYVKA